MRSRPRRRTRRRAWNRSPCGYVRWPPSPRRPSRWSSRSAKPNPSASRNAPLPAGNASGGRRHRARKPSRWYRPVTGHAGGQSRYLHARERAKFDMEAARKTARKMAGERDPVQGGHGRGANPRQAAANGKPAGAPTSRKASAAIAVHRLCGRRLAGAGSLLDKHSG